MDKVGHGAGQSGVCIIPVERLSELREVRDIMFSWMRPMAVLTSQFFLSDEGDDVEMPLHINIITHFASLSPASAWPSLA